MNYLDILYNRLNEEEIFSVVDALNILKEEVKKQGRTGCHLPSVCGLGHLLRNDKRFKNIGRMIEDRKQYYQPERTHYMRV